MIKILFLDIDGVLNNEIMYHKDSIRTSRPFPLDQFDPECVYLLNDIVNKTGCKIVLSSSWRIEGKEAVNNIFKQVGLPEIYDITPITLNRIEMTRGEEIKEWLKFRESVNYVIVDDDNDMLKEQEPYFVQTDYFYGLTREKADEIINLFHQYDIDYWKDIKPITKDTYHVVIPIYKDKEFYRKEIVPLIIEKGAIPKDKLEIGCWYYGHCRNASKAKWLGDKFEYIRNKFGFTYPEKIDHFDSDTEYDVFVPVEKVE